MGGHLPALLSRPGIKDTLASTGRGRIKTAMGFEIDVALAGLGGVKVREFDGIFLPGGMDPGTGRFPRALGEDQALLGLLREFAGEGKAVAGICGAPLVLGAAGLLKDRKFACDITEDTRGWFEGAIKVDDVISIEIARLLGDDKTAGVIEAFFVR